MSKRVPEGKLAPEMIVLGRDTAARTLCEHAFISILRDYADIVYDSMDGLLLQIEMLGFRLHDLVSESDSESKGTLLYRDDGGKLVAIAFIGLVRSLEDGGMTVEINRLDKGRMDTLELREATSWN